MYFFNLLESDLQFLTRIKTPPSRFKHKKCDICVCNVYVCMCTLLFNTTQSKKRGRRYLLKISFLNCLRIQKIFFCFRFKAFPRMNETVKYLPSLRIFAIVIKNRMKGKFVVRKQDNPFHRRLSTVFALFSLHKDHIIDVNFGYFKHKCIINSLVVHPKFDTGAA